MGADYKTFLPRKSDGWGLREALEAPKRDFSVRDHEGTVFPSVKSMCERRGVSTTTYSKRRKEGMGVGEALTHNSRATKDHLGKPYRNIKEMIAAWQVPWETYKRRKKDGWELSRILETGPGKDAWHDHLGNEYETKKAMLDRWGRSRKAYDAYIEAGFTVEEALTAPPGLIKSRCADHEGREFKSRKEMCEHWGIAKATLSSRLAQGWSLKDALETPVAGRALAGFENLDPAGAPAAGGLFACRCKACGWEAAITKEEMRRHRESGCRWKF